MQDNQALFSLNIDPETKTHLSDTAKWAKFLSITGIILLALAGVASILGIGFSNQMTTTSSDFDVSGVMGQMRIVMIVVTLIIITIMFFPLLFLLRFANQMKTSLAANDQQSLIESFLNLKRYFRFLGILVIIIVAMYLLLFVVLIAGYSMA
ncbi:MAG: hypothetical protein H0U44_02965 [Flavisolibacter sp.]|jgi:hypothetical protein|nr:hypothetical protein [Flavisolibacter sp.]